MNATTQGRRPTKHGAPKKSTKKAATQAGDALPLPLRLARASALGTLSSCLAALVLSLVGAAAVSGGSDPDLTLLPLSIGVTALSTLLGGLVTRRTSHLSPLACGLAHGACFLLLTMALAGLADTDDAMRAALRWGLRASALAFSILGALMGANLPKARKRKRRT